jgi:hypothetical protein
MGIRTRAAIITTTRHPTMIAPHFKKAFIIILLSKAPKSNPTMVKCVVETA